MDRDKVLERLEEFNTYVLPKEIDYDAYVEFIGFITPYWNGVVSVHCNGSGGETDYAFAIVDLIREHGKVSTYLTGMAFSCHSVIFAAGAERFVSEHGAIGIHQPYFENSTGSADAFQERSNRLDNLKAQIAKIYAYASNKETSWWLDRINSISDGRFKRYGADMLIHLDFAQPMYDWKKVTEDERSDV